MSRRDGALVLVLVLVLALALADIDLVAALMQVQQLSGLGEGRAVLGQLVGLKVGPGGWRLSPAYDLTPCPPT